MSPDAFWSMHPAEFWWLFEAKTTPEQRETPADKFADLEDLLDDVVDPYHW